MAVVQTASVSRRCVCFILFVMIDFQQHYLELCCCLETEGCSGFTDGKGLFSNTFADVFFFALSVTEDFFLPQINPITHIFNVRRRLIV